MLFLNGNMFDGPIPSSLSSLKGLDSLDVSDNNLSGAIPEFLASLKVLKYLNLSFNDFEGVMPAEGVFKNVSAIFVEGNNKLCGGIPELHLLSGLVPNNLGSCVSLEKLFLNDNLFEGPLPSSLSSLKGLEALDLSDNNLSGAIPDFLVSFSALRYLNLSFNDFEGVIPSKGVFKNASATFVEGNNKLCEGIPELHLSRCNTKTSPNTSHKLKIVIIVMTLGVALVFTCLLILWFRKKKEQKPITASVENSILQLSYQSIQRATEGFAMKNLVGTRGFGSVYKGILEENGTTIAVKVLNLLNRGASRSFLTECEALKNIRHRNLVKILTSISSVDYKGNDFKALVYEFMVNGSLEDWTSNSGKYDETAEFCIFWNHAQRSGHDSGHDNLTPPYSLSTATTQQTRQPPISVHRLTMVRTREQARRRPQEPAVNAGRRRFAPPQFMDVPSASEGSQPSRHAPRQQEEGAGASTQPFQQPNSPWSVQRPSDPQPAASPVQRRPSTEQPRRSSSRQQASSSFHSMPTVDSSQSMPDYEHSSSMHSAHPTQPNEVPGFMRKDLLCLHHSHHMLVRHPLMACSMPWNPLRKILPRAPCLMLCLILQSDIDEVGRTPDAPFIIPSGIPTPRNERVSRRGTPSQPPPDVPPPPNVNSEMREVQGRLNSIETNIAEILSYLRPGTSRRGRGRGRR
ncbi:hypothetical protein GQ457_14G023750 [Hibiscus cannabinus]